MQGTKLRFVEIAGAVQKFEPIVGFVGLLQCDLHLRDKICSAVGVLRFPDIGADGSTAFPNLTGDDIFMLLLKLFDKREDFNREIHRLDGQAVSFFHLRISVRKTCPQALAAFRKDSRHGLFGKERYKEAG